MRAAIGMVVAGVLCGVVVAPASADSAVTPMPVAPDPAPGVHYESSSQQMVMQAGSPQDAWDPLATAQNDVDDTNRWGEPLATRVTLDSFNELPDGFFFIRMADGGCLSVSDASVGASLGEAQCSVGSQIFYLAPSFRPGGYELQIPNHPDLCVRETHLAQGMFYWHSPTLILDTCTDHQDANDALSSPGTQTADASDMTWNFFPIDSSGKVQENTDVKSIPLSGINFASNKITVCNWGAYTLYYKIDGTITDGNGKDSTVSYQSGTVTGSTCSTQTLAGGFINATVSTYLEMEAGGSDLRGPAGTWVQSGQYQFIGWNADVTAHTKGDLCDNWGWATARSTNKTAAYVTYPGTDCNRDTTKGVTTQLTNDDFENYILGMMPFLGLTVKENSAPESFFSNLSSALGVKITLGVGPVSGNYYKNIMVLGYHAKAS